MGNWVRRLGGARISRWGETGTKKLKGKWLKRNLSKFQISKSWQSESLVLKIEVNVRKIMDSLS